MHNYSHIGVFIDFTQTWNILECKFNVNQCNIEENKTSTKGDFLKIKRIFIGKFWPEIDRRLIFSKRVRRTGMIPKIDIIIICQLKVVILK